MSLDKIRNLESEVKALKEANEAKATEADKLREEFSSVKDTMAERTKKFEESSKPSEKEVAKASAKMKDLYLQSVMLERDMKDLKGFKESASVLEKALAPSDLTNWAATEFSNQLIEELELDLMIPNMFAQIQVPDNRQTLAIPAKTGNMTAYLTAPAASVTESAIDDGKVSFAVKKFKAYSAIADEADYEMVAAVTDITRREIVQAVGRGMEHAILNGDTTVTTGTDVRKAFDGLRKFANANAESCGSAITVAKVNATRKKMGIWGINQNDLVLIVNPNVFYQLVGLEQFLTMDKIGNKATLLTGQVGQIFGIPVVVSSYIANDLETDGSDHDTAGATTEAILVNKNYFVVATRGGFTIETDRNIVAGTNSIVGGRYVDFGKWYTGTNTPIAALVNVTP